MSAACHGLTALGTLGSAASGWQIATKPCAGWDV